jgi:hypothetical protein
MIEANGPVKTKKRHFLHAIYVSKRAFCPDRLETNIGKAPLKTRE